MAPITNNTIESIEDEIFEHVLRIKEFPEMLKAQISSCDLQKFKKSYYPEVARRAGTLLNALATFENYCDSLFKHEILLLDELAEHRDLLRCQLVDPTSIGSEGRIAGLPIRGSLAAAASQLDLEDIANFVAPSSTSSSPTSFLTSSSIKGNGHEFSWNVDTWSSSNKHMSALLRNHAKVQRRSHKISEKSITLTREYEHLRKEVYGRDCIGNFIAKLPRVPLHRRPTGGSHTQTVHADSNGRPLLKYTSIACTPCPICLKPFGETDKEDGKIVRMPCHETHIFHTVCLKNWFQVSPCCPLDQLSITQLDKILEEKGLGRKEKKLCKPTATPKQLNQRLVPRLLEQRYREGVSVKSVRGLGLDQHHRHNGRNRCGPRMRAEYELMFD